MGIDEQIRRIQSHEARARDAIALVAALLGFLLGWIVRGLAS